MKVGGPKSSTDCPSISKKLSLIWAAFSPRNLKYMRAFAEAYPDMAIVQRVVAQIPWKSNLALLDKVKDYSLRLWYAQKNLRKWLVTTSPGVSDCIGFASTPRPVGQ